MSMLPTVVDFSDQCDFSLAVFLELIQFIPQLARRSSGRTGKLVSCLTINYPCCQIPFVY